MVALDVRLDSERQAPLPSAPGYGSDWPSIVSSAERPDGSTKNRNADDRRPYDMRHTYATWSLRAGVNTFQLAKRMGTSLEMIDNHYGHLVRDSAEHELRMLDEFDERQ